MKENKRAWDFLSLEQRKAMTKEIINHFASERDETIGIVAAESILDFFLQSMGSTIYNKALDDIRPLLANSVEETLLNLDVSLRKNTEKKIPR